MNRNVKNILCTVLFMMPVLAPAQKTIEYDLYVKDSLVNFSGKTRTALAINGQIPAPTLYFTEGDTAVIRVHNLMNRATSIHWHGLLLPNPQDGVPFLTSAPVAPGTTHVYKFPVIQNGTYWYHSHAGLQEQQGLYGAFVIYKRPDDVTRRKEDDLPEYTVVLSDWTNEKPKEINRKLHVGSDWFSIEKNSVQSYWEALRSGYLKTKLLNEWKRMEAMDVSDVYYNCFLANGREDVQLKKPDKENKIRLRIINGGSSTYFWLQYAGGPVTVIAADGKDVQPVSVDRMIIAVSETYDVVLTVPDEHFSYEFRATAEDRNGGASLWLGKGEKKSMPPLPRLNYFAGMKMMNKMMKMDGNMSPMGMKMTLQKMDMNEVMYPELSEASYSGHGSMNMEHKDHHSMHNMDMTPALKTLNYGMLRSTVKTTLPDTVPVKDLRFELTGNMNRYIWSINNKTLSETDKILIKEGENVRIAFYNNTMMRHPMHLHGHFFRVFNGHGEYAPMKFTLDIMPMETDTIEFNANEKSRGDWYFHCHILYHMMSGMGRIFSYEDSPYNPQIPDPQKAVRKVYHMDRKFYFSIENDFAFNGNNGQLALSNTRWALEGEWQLGYNDRRGYEAEARFGRYIGRMQWFYPYIGVDWSYKRGERNEKNIFGQRFKRDRQIAATLGLRYTLPWLIIADAQINTYGRVRLQLERDDIPLTRRLRMNLMVNTDKEYFAGLRYIILPYLGISVHYDSDLKFGAGVVLNY